MATTDTTVSNLIINKLTKAQYDAIQSPSDTELYLIPDEIDSVPTSGSDNPVKSGGVYSALANKANSADLAAVATSGSYNDLSNKPTIPDAQIQSDWNQSNTSAKDFIKNKPTIPTVPTNVSAFTNDAGYLTSHQSLTNYVQKSQTAGLLKNDGTVDTNTYLTQHQDISGKADKVVVVDGSTLPASLEPNKVYQLGTLTGSVTIPAFASVDSGDTEAKIWCFTFDTSTTAPTITWSAGIIGWSGGSAPTINASKSYEVTVMDGIGVIIEA